MADSLSNPQIKNAPLTVAPAYLLAVDGDPSSTTYQELVAVDSAAYAAPVQASVTTDDLTALQAYVTTNNIPPGSLLLYHKPVDVGTGRFEFHGPDGSPHDPIVNGPIKAFAVYDGSIQPKGLIPGSSEDWQFTNWEATTIRMGEQDKQTDWSTAINYAIESLPSQQNGISGGGTSAVYSGIVRFRNSDQNPQSQFGTVRAYSLNSHINTYKYLSIEGEGSNTIIKGTSAWSGGAAPDGEKYLFQPPFLLSEPGANWQSNYKDLNIFCSTYDTPTTPPSEVSGIYWDASMQSTMDNVRIRNPLLNGVTISGNSDTPILKQVIVEGFATQKAPVCFNILSPAETITLINCESQICETGILAVGAGPIKVINHESEECELPYHFRGCPSVDVDGNIQNSYHTKGVASELASSFPYVASIAAPGLITTTGAHGLVAGDEVVFQTGTFTVTGAKPGGTGTWVVDSDDIAYVTNVVSPTAFNIGDVQGASLPITVGGSGNLIKGFSALAKVVISRDAGGSPFNSWRRRVNIAGTRDVDTSNNRTPPGIVVSLTSDGSAPFTTILTEQYKVSRNSYYDFDFALDRQEQSNFPTYGPNGYEVLALTDLEYDAVDTAVVPDAFPAHDLIATIGTLGGGNVATITGGYVGQTLTIVGASGVFTTTGNLEVGANRTSTGTSVIKFVRLLSTWLMISFEAN